MRVICIFELSARAVHQVSALRRGRAPHIRRWHFQSGLDFIVLCWPR